MALGTAGSEPFLREVRRPDVADAVMEVDALVETLFDKYFGDAADPAVQSDYLEATFRFALDTLPPATERDARIPVEDPRKRTAGRHRLEGDLMWFIWALQVEAANAIAGVDRGYARRTLLLAGVAVGCPVDFVWRGHRRTRPEYGPNSERSACCANGARLGSGTYRPEQTRFTCCTGFENGGTMAPPMANSPERKVECGGYTCCFPGQFTTRSHCPIGITTIRAKERVRRTDSDRAPRMRPWRRAARRVCLSRRCARVSS